ncbi:NUDIX hydrolase [Pseudonocardia sulfidoxydans NBRC 16205]|uniref:NUDIX hydrolase n=1 Tax=Pseudonocardia sulfidoxydans NBRC 16205 TaxID=1223511 RepID=A0A511DQK5_9PSEU|nr:NUDIX domain-containing protein [Pseudonocardia sulfidoxydans]GEL27126.1 NUDIX hydrolase [Pseudonocardia sulfidoxydans NBRC 16205]
MARTDYLDDPDAPDPTSIVIAASAFVIDGGGRLLMIRRTDSGLHALPGGRHELGETMTQAAVRETREETGVDIEVTGLIGIYSNPAHVVQFTDGEVRQEFSICFRARPVSGEPRTSDESTEVRWVEPPELKALEIHPSIRLRIEHGFEQRSEPYYT